MMEFIISGKDYSKYVQDSTYHMDETEEFGVWDSADYVRHKDLERTRVSGSFDMVFVSENSEDYKEFLEFLNVVTENHIITCSLYITNKGIVKENVKFYYSIAYKDHVNTNGSIYKDRITVTLEEK